MCLVCVRLCALKPLLVWQLCERGVSVCIALKGEVVKYICSHVFSSVYISYVHLKTLLVPLSRDFSLCHILLLLLH